MTQTRTAERAGMAVVEWAYEHMDSIRAGDIEECVNVVLDDEANQDRAWSHLEVSQVPDDLIEALQSEVQG